MNGEKVQTVFLLDTRPTQSPALQRYCRALCLACIRILLFLAQFPNKEHLGRVRWNYNFFNSHRPERSVRSKTAQFYENRSEFIEKFFNELQSNLEIASKDPVNIPVPSSKHKPVKLVYSALASAVQDFVWDAPEILSPVRRLSAHGKSKKSARGQKSDTGATNVSSGRNIIFVCSPCPRSETDLLHFCYGGSRNSSASIPTAAGDRKRATVSLEMLQSELLPSALHSQLAAKGIAVHWLDTSGCLMEEGRLEGRTEQASGCSLMSEALRVIGGTVIPISCLVSPVCSRLIQQARNRTDEQLAMKSDSHTKMQRVIPTTCAINVQPQCQSSFQGGTANGASAQESNLSPKSDSHSTFQFQESSKPAQTSSENPPESTSDPRAPKPSFPLPTRQLSTTLALPAATQLGEYLQRCVRPSACSLQQSALGRRRPDDANLFWFCTSVGEAMCILKALPMHCFANSRLSDASISSTQQSRSGSGSGSGSGSSMSSQHGGESQLDRERQTQATDRRARVYASAMSKPSKRQIKKKLSFSSADKQSQTQKKDLESNEQSLNSAHHNSEAAVIQARLQHYRHAQEPTGTQPQFHRAPTASDTQADSMPVESTVATTVPHAIALGVVKQGEIPLSWLDPTNAYSCVGLYVPRAVRSKPLRIAIAKDILTSNGNQRSQGGTSSVPEEPSDPRQESGTCGTSTAGTVHLTSPTTPKAFPATARKLRSLSLSPYERALHSCPRIHIYRTPPGKNGLKRLMKRALSDGAVKVPRKSHAISQLRRSPRLSTTRPSLTDVIPISTDRSTESRDRNNPEKLLQLTAFPSTKLGPQSPNNTRAPPAISGESTHLHDSSREKPTTPWLKQERGSASYPTTPNSSRSRHPLPARTPPLSSATLFPPQKRRQSPRTAIRGILPNYHELLTSDRDSRTSRSAANERSLEGLCADTQLLQPPPLPPNQPQMSSSHALMKRTSLLVRIPLRKLQPLSESTRHRHFPSDSNPSLHPPTPSSTVPATCTASQPPQEHRKVPSDPGVPPPATAFPTGGGGGAGDSSYLTLQPGDSLARSGRYLSRQFQSLCLWLAKNRLLLLVGVDPATPAPEPASVGVLQPITSLVGTLTLVQPRYHARLLARLGTASCQQAPEPQRHDSLARLQTPREESESERPDCHFTDIRAEPESKSDVSTRPKRKSEVSTGTGPERKSGVSTGTGPERKSEVSTGTGPKRKSEVSTGTGPERKSEEEFVARYAGDSELYTSLHLLFHNSRQPADENLQCALLQSAVEVSPFSPLSLSPWFPYLQACGVSHCTAERLRELQLECRDSDDASSKDHRRRELLSALRQACAPGASQAPPGREEGGEAMGRSEGEGEAMETDGPVSQPKVEEKEVYSEEQELESTEPKRLATVEEVLERFHSEYAEQVRACHDGETLQVWAAKAVSRLRSDFCLLASATGETGEFPRPNAQLWELLGKKVLLDSRQLREKYEAVAGEGGSVVQERVAEYQLQVLLHCEAMRVCGTASYDASAMAEQLVLLLRRISLLTNPGLLGHCLKELILPNYADSCRAVLAEVYEGLMLPLPLQLYCSPGDRAPNSTGYPGNSSGEEESPIKSLEEPQAPKQPQNTAKSLGSLARHTSFHDAHQTQRQITVPKRANKRKRSKGSKDDLELKTRRFSPRLKKLSEEGTQKAKGVCRSLFSRSHSVSYEAGQQVGTKRKREQEEVEKHVPKRPKSVQRHHIHTDILVKETPLKKQQVENYRRFKLQRLRSKSQMEISPGVMAISESPRRSFYSATVPVRSKTTGTFKTPPLKHKHLSPRVILNKEPSPAALLSLLHGEMIAPATTGGDTLASASAQGNVIKESPDLFEMDHKETERAAVREQSSSSRAARMLTYDTEDPLRLPRHILKSRTPAKDGNSTRSDVVSRSGSGETVVCFLTDLDPNIGNESASMMAFALSTPTKEDPTDFHQAFQCIN